jgi:hypothetical protein
MRLGDRTQDRLLHQIVGPVTAPRERPRITAEPGNFALDKIMKVGHHASSFY